MARVVFCMMTFTFSHERLFFKMDSGVSTIDRYTYLKPKSAISQWNNQGSRDGILASDGIIPHAEGDQLRLAYHHHKL